MEASCNLRAQKMQLGSCSKAVGGGDGATRGARRGPICRGWDGDGDGDGDGRMARLLTAVAAAITGLNMGATQDGPGRGSGRAGFLGRLCVAILEQLDIV